MLINKKDKRVRKKMKSYLLLLKSFFNLKINIKLENPRINIAPILNKKYSIMKVLHIVGGKLNNGAVKGAKILHEALLDQKIDSLFITKLLIIFMTLSCY